MKKFIALLFNILVLVIIFNLFLCSKVNAQIISDNHILGQVNNMKLEYINDNSEYLFVSTNSGIYLINPETFKVEKYIKIEGDISEFFLINNIEDSKSPNKDLVIFIDDDNLPSVIVYSMDSLEKIWSFTAITTGYNNESIKIEKKMPIFDYDLNEDSILLVSGYNLYSLNIKTGKQNWVYKHEDNIWAVSYMSDINSDNKDDIAISVQPSNVIGLNGKDGEKLWEKKIAKSYKVKRNDKVIGTTKLNIWDLMYVNSNLIATGEDGYLYQVNPNNGQILKEKSILENIPNILAFQIYLEGNKAKDYSELVTNGKSAYQIINSKKVNDSDILVTIFENNQYANYSGLTPEMYLVDGKTLDIIWQEEYSGKQLLDINYYNNGSISFFDGKKINIFSINNHNNVKEINLGSNSNKESNPIYSILKNDTLIVSDHDISKLDISDNTNPSVVNKITSFNGYDTIVNNDYIYKLYYQYDINNRVIKNYSAVECTDKVGNVIWKYNLDNIDDYFNFYLINDGFIFITNKYELYKINYTDKLTIETYQLPSDIENQPKDYDYNKIHALTTCSDFNNDNTLDLLIVLENGNFFILNSKDFNDVIIKDNLNSIINLENQWFSYAFPIFNENEKKLYVMSENKIEILSFDDQLTTSIEKEVSLENFNFWNDGQSIKNNIDFDNDGYKDFVLRINNNDFNEALILYSDGTIGKINIGWDFTLYPTYIDLNDDNKFEIIVTSSQEDGEGNWQSVCKIVDPYTSINEEDNVLFHKVFYEGNEITSNSKYKPLEIVDDITGDGIKDVVVLVDRWGDNYFQVYNVNDDTKVVKVIPISVRFTEREEMKDSKIGAPGAFIDTFTYDDNQFMFLTFNQNENMVTSMFNINDFYDTQNLLNINGRILNYYIEDSFVLYNLFNKKNEENFISNTLDLNSKIKINIDENTVYKQSNININWDKDISAVFYRIYVDNRLVEITSKNEVNVFLKDGLNNVGIGSVLENGTELITNFHVKVDLDNSNNYMFYLYSVSSLFVVFVLPVKFFRYRKRGH
ncbi:PQQ-binding-like beta-propeller repeat protein [Mycoplasmatota bacterium]|nr:PQQ-binding-like beta-propeller repeat protein [Mycoplasmatota bacterium]